MRAINSSVMRKVNRCMVLNYIRQRPISRAEIADETQLTRASITQIVDELMRDGLVMETAPVSGGGPGRKQRKLALVENALCVAGVNLSSRGYDIGIINLGGKVLWHGCGVVENRTPDEVMDEIARRLNEVVGQLDPAPRRIFGVGVNLPSPLSMAKEMNWEASRHPCWRDVCVEEMLREKLGWEVFLGHISTSYALEELYFGIGYAGVENFMLLHVDENVDAGFVLGGELFVSARGRFPEVGHITINRAGEPCSCGSRGCLEKYIAFPRALEGSGYASWQQVIDRMDSDPQAQELFMRIAGDLAFEIVNIINVLDLDKVVLAGEYFYGGDRLAAEVNARMKGCSLRLMSDETVVPGRKDDMARIAAMPAYHTLFAC